MKRAHRSGRARADWRQLSFGCLLGSVIACATAAAQPGGGPAGEQTGALSGRTRAAKQGPIRMPPLGIATFGGGVQDAQQTAQFAPFSGAYGGAKLLVQAWDGSLAALQRHAELGGREWDAVLMPATPLRIACRQGLLLPHPLTRDPADQAPDSSGAGCDVPAWRMNVVLAWDKSRVDTTPRWSDFWDVARRPGKRGLQRDPRGALEIALMADGVAPEDVYRTLAAAGGVDRAFRKLDQLKPYIVWWSTPAEAVQIIESGAVLMTSAPAGEVAMADQTGHGNFGMQWAQSLALDVGWATPRSSMHRDMAQKLLRFLAAPALRGAFVSAYPVLPPQLEGGQDQPALMLDDAFWLDQLVPLQKRFEQWASHS